MTQLPTCRPVALLMAGMAAIPALTMHTAAHAATSSPEGSIIVTRYVLPPETETPAALAAPAMIAGMPSPVPVTHVIAEDIEDQATTATAPAPAIAYGPADPDSDVARMDGKAPPNPDAYRGFGRQIGAIKWEVAALFGYYTLSNSEKLFQNPVAPHIQKEGWFGRDTHNVGVDKLAHAYSAYVISEIAWGRLKRKTGAAPGTALTAAAVGTGVMLYSEFFDSIEKSGGWSWEDVAFNTAGAAFSAIRNSVPGLDRKLDFRLMIVPNGEIFTREGKEHFEQQRYFLALKLSGFKPFENSPARFLELHAGYYGKDFTNKDRAAGIIPKRRIFLGVGINLRELFFKDPKSRIGRAAGEALDYFQPPYTALHRHITN